jgi:hypothetical protein
MTRRQFFATLFAVAVIAPLTRLGWLKPDPDTVTLPLVPCPLVDGAGQTGCTLATDGWAASTAVLQPGDVITFASCHALNPRTLGEMTFRKQFVVTDTVKSDRRGRAKVPVFPPVVPSGPHRNVGHSPANNARIDVVGGLPPQYAAIRFSKIELTCRVLG